MPTFYYIDFFYDPKERSFEAVVDGCVSGMLESGCRFQKVVMSIEGLKQMTTLEEHIILKPGDLGMFAGAYAREMQAEGQALVSFPPLGRVIFEYDFRFDEEVLEELEQEEADTHSRANLIGLNFIYSHDEAVGRRIKASLSFWEEYILTYGDGGANRYNMGRILEMVREVCARTGPYFGAMNTELHLDTDKALELLLKKGVPSGNEFVIVGEPLRDKVSFDALKSPGLAWKDLPGGGVLIRWSDKWDLEGLTS
jgi:hypothetical protein